MLKDFVNVAYWKAVERIVCISSRKKIHQSSIYYENLLLTGQQSIAVHARGTAQ